MRYRDEVLSLFVAAVRETPAVATDAPRPVVVDHIPPFLDEIVAALRRSSASGEADPRVSTATASRHGEQRWELGYDLGSLIREYGILRSSIATVAEQHGVAVPLEEFHLLSRCLNLGLTKAGAAYTAFRDEEVHRHERDLEFLVQAGELLSSSLDSRATVNRLTTLAVPRLADWCAIQLDVANEREFHVAHVDPAKAQLVRALYDAEGPGEDSPLSLRRALKTRSAELFQAESEERIAAAATTPGELANLQELAVTSFMIVPLQVEQTVFGALILGYSESNRRYTERDLKLGLDLGRRAGAAIDNSRLFELSQRERARVEAATRAKDEFVAMVSHELRTPLTAILGWTRLMRSKTLTEEKREHAMSVIERNAVAQNRLVGDLLDISRVVTGRLRMSPAQVDMADVVDIAIEDARPAAEAKRIRITASVDHVGTVLRGDAERLQQVVWNLLANGIKFTPKDGAIDVELKRVNSDLVLVVADTGEGIAPSFLPHIFDVFRQYDTTSIRPHGGLGIGLSIAMHIVEQHGGSIKAESPGRGLGATMTVRLPVSALVSSTLGVSRVPAATRAATALPEGADWVRVLIVEDEPDARELIAYLFETCGMETRAAATADAGLALLNEFLPSVVVCDIGLPGEDGYTLIRRIRALSSPETSKVPAIALTAFASGEDRTRALVAGFNLHMVKPVEPSALVQAVLDLAGPREK